MPPKKKSSGQKRINKDVLERARQQARALEEQDDDSVAESVEPAEPVSQTPATAASSAPVRRSVSTAKRLREKNEEARKKALTAEEITELLANPTKVVTSDELRAQYGFVLADLRSMGILAAASFGVLILLALVLPR
ncbi:MAG: hypothetical protein IPM16_03245 [Chloroflexi bacterium]|nr:hypothetical protein [Chloroflexota bacterium]